MAQDRYQELRERRQQAHLGGGQARIEAQHAKGKHTARERLALLLDQDTFQEIGLYVTNRQPDLDPIAGDAVVTGYGLVDGRRVCVYAQDFTVFGGSFSEAQAMKVSQLMDLALQGGLPVIGLNDSVGARIQEGVFSLAGYAELFWRNTQASGVVPQISVMLGPCAGGSVYSPGLTDFVIMTRQLSHMFITGPDVIRTVTGEEVDFETLGGADIHAQRSGVAHFAANDEEHALIRIQAVPLDCAPSEALAPEEASAPPRTALARLAAALRRRETASVPATADEPGAPILSLVDPRDIYLA